MILSGSPYWWPIALSDEIKATLPRALMVNQIPLVAFRTPDNQVHLLNDWCPHRFAPLSQGKIINGELQCPYHGWQFNGKGVCTRVPGLEAPPSCSPIIKTYATQEQAGLLWVSEASTPRMLCLPSAQQQTLDTFFIQGEVQCELVDLIENYLDGFHTHFVHAGWIRKDQQRQTIQANIKPLADGLEVEYTGETLQNGFISRWLEPERGTSRARFRLPNMAELEYRDSQDRLSLLATLWATPIAENHHTVFVRVATPNGKLPARLKAFFLRRFFTKILQQDKTILERSHQRKCAIANTELPSKQPLDTPNDLLAPLLRQLIATQNSFDFPHKICAVNL